AAPLGRDQQVADACSALRAGVPVEFHGPCGVGKSTVLRHLVAAARIQLGVPGVYLPVAQGEAIGDILQRLVFALYASDQPVKLTRDECAALLRQTGAVVALDDVTGDRAEVLALV